MLHTIRFRWNMEYHLDNSQMGFRTVVWVPGPADRIPEIPKVLLNRPPKFRRNHSDPYE